MDNGRKRQKLSSLCLPGRKAMLPLKRRLASILSIANLSYWEYDADLHFSYWEGTGTEINPQLLEKLLGTSITETPNEIQLKEGKDSFRKLLEQHSAFREVDISYTDRQNNTHHASISGDPVYDDDGRFIGYCGIRLKISQQKLIERRQNRLAKMYAVLGSINEAILRASSEDELCHQVCMLVTENSEFLFSAVFFVDESRDHLEIIALSGIDASKFPRFQLPLNDSSLDNTMVVTAFKHGEIQVNNDYLDTPQTRFYREARSVGMNAVCTLPIFRNGYITGVLLVASASKNAFDEDNINLVRRIRDNLSFALGNLDREAQIQKTSQALEEIQLQLRLAMDIANAGFYRFSISPETGEVRDFNKQAENEFNIHFCPAHLFGYPPGTILYLATLLERIHPDDKETAVNMFRHKLAEKQSHYSYKFRVIWPDGSTHWLETRANIDYDAKGKPQQLVGIVIDITDRRLAEDRMQYMATHDSLTGLPNRVLFRELLEMEAGNWRRYGNAFAVLFIDLDNFKPVNDELGHHAGDLLLQEIALRFRACIRASDTIARLGGDEFIVLLRNISDLDSIAKIAEKLVANAALPFYIHDQQQCISTSVGVALYPDNAQDIDTLIKYADCAMYQAKHQGKNHYCFYKDSFAKL